MSTDRLALLIGVNDYGGASGLAPLRYAEADVKALAGVLQERGGFAVETLVGQAATRDAIEEAVFTARAGDTFLFFFAGHGQLVGGQYVLHPYGSSASGLRSLPLAQLSNHWQNCSQYENILTILDACRSAPGARGRSAFDAASRDIIARMTEGERWVEVLYGCREGQVSYEVEELGHGLLTAAMLEVMQGPEELDTTVLSGKAADWMRRWCQRDTQGRRQEAYRYYRPSAEHRIVVVPGRAPVIPSQPRVEREDVVVLPGPPVPPLPRKQVCPCCGLRNDPDETFECRVCKRDYLCERHWVEEKRCCEECAERMEREEQARRAEKARKKAEAAVKAEREARKRAEQERRKAEETKPKEWEGPGPGKVARVDLGSGVVLAMVGIPPGEFMMGSPEGEEGRSDGEVQHKVKLTKGFWLGKYAVTQAEYEAVMGKNPSNFKGAKRPVENVSWAEAVAFCNALSEREGLRPAYRISGNDATRDREADGYRLPTEAEWEYACRAGTESPFHTGKCLSTDEANYDGNYPLEGCPKGEYRKETWQVGSGAKNSWGLYDMHGNVWEWCWDWYEAYPKGSATDPLGPSGGSYRVLRGGCWYDSAQYCRSAYRFSLDPGSRSDGYGFRVVRAPGQR